MVEHSARLSPVRWEHFLWLCSLYPPQESVRKLTFSDVSPAHIRSDQLTAPLSSGSRDGGAAQRFLAVRFLSIC